MAFPEMLIDDLRVQAVGKGVEHRRGVLSTFSPSAHASGTRRDC